MFKILITSTNVKAMHIALNNIGVASNHNGKVCPYYIYLRDGKDYSWSDIKYGDDNYPDMRVFTWEDE